MGPFQRLLFFPLAALLTFASSTAALAGRQPVDTGGVERDFETILDLWRDGRFGELYERTYATGTKSLESFVGRMNGGSRKPACCWEKLQVIRVTASSTERASLFARVGLEGPGGRIEYQSRSFPMRREEGMWKISLADLLSLAGSSRGKRSRRLKF